MYKKSLLVIIFFCNISYTMENPNEALSLEIQKFNNLLRQDLAESSKTITSVTTGWTDSQKCLYGSLAGLGLCSLACAQNASPQVIAMGATLCLGTGALSLAAMNKEKKINEIYTQDQKKLNASIKELNQIINSITQTNTTPDIQQSMKTTSTTRQVHDKNIDIIQTCNINYAATLDLLKKFTNEYQSSKICFYAVLLSILSLSLECLGKNNADRVTGISILLLGTSVFGIISALREEAFLKNCIDIKASTRESIIEINRS